MIDEAFDTYQAVQVNPVGSGFSVFSAYAVFPGRSESGAFDSAQKVNAIGGDTQLENLLISLRIQKIWTAKFGECDIRKFNIVLTGINPYVYILGIARFRMIDESKATDDQVSDMVFM
jgi:hypothetical protein